MRGSSVPPMVTLPSSLAQAIAIPVEDPLMLPEEEAIYPIPSLFLHRFTPLPAGTDVTQCNLWYFFLQAPQSTEPGRTEISLQEALRRVHGVVFDRGPVADASDQLARQMADSTLRLQSFKDSRFWRRGHGHALCLTLLGYYHIGEHDSVDKIRCSFCRRTFATGPYFESSPAEIEFETQLVHLQQRHAVRSPTCPFALGVRGDNVPFTAIEMERAIRDATATSMLLHRPTLSTYQHIELLTYAQEKLSIHTGAAQQVPIQGPEQEAVAGATPEVSTFRALLNYLPELDHLIFYHVRAEFDCEPFSSFHRLEYEIDDQDRLTNLDGYVAQQTLLDIFLFKQARFPEFVTVIARLESYQRPDWVQQQGTSPPHEQLADAGFYFTGTGDSCRCHQCALGLNRWAPTDNVWREHARFAPRCAWLLRRRGRQFVKGVLVGEIRQPGDAQATPELIAERERVTTEWDDLNGLLNRI